MRQWSGIFFLVSEPEDNTDDYSLLTHEETWKLSGPVGACAFGIWSLATNYFFCHWSSESFSATATTVLDMRNNQ